MNRYGLILVASILLLPGCISSEDAPQPNVLEQQSTSTALSRERLRQVATAITVRVHANDNSGSGVLIRKDGQFDSAHRKQLYTVLTNAHVLIPGKPYGIVTPDGKTHAATLMAKYNNRSDGGYNLDLALLQFEAADDYEVASIANSPLVGEQPVFASGFPYDADKLQFTEGKIPSWAMSLGKQALQDGYQIGYSNEIRQGMSGGPILNGSGELIGINGLSAYPILPTAYVFENGESPTDALLADLNRVSWGIPIGRLLEVEPSFGETGPYATFDPASLTGVAAEVNKIAQEITVRIDESQANGSGIIIAERGNSYYVLTAKHVVDNEEKYQVVTHDGKRYPVDYGTVQQLGVDLAVLQFQSQESYRVATLANYDQENGNWVFLSGWPGLELGEIGRPYPLFTAGRVFSKEWGAIKAKDSYSLTKANGYELVYTNPTLGGMSGGPVLDSRGRVIGIHAAAEGDMLSGVQLGYSLGVPVRTFLSLASRAQIWLKVEESIPPPLNRGEITAIREALFTAKKPSKGAKEEEWVNYGNQLWRFCQCLCECEESVEVVAAFDEAIKLNSDFDEAWYARGLALIWQGQYQAAVESFKKATEISPNFYQAWRERGEALYSLKRYTEALASVDKAIAINPKDFVLYLLRGELLQELERDAEAVEAYSQAIKIKPHQFAYNNRGITRKKLGDYKGAIADYNKAIKINEKLAESYLSRGLARRDLGDYKEANADFSKAIKINPDYALAYNNRGLVRKILGDLQGAIADYNQAIKLDPDYALAYMNRAYARKDLGEKKGAIEDMQKIVQIFCSQGKERGKCKEAQERLRTIQW